MFCASCGSEVREGQMHCGSCGAPAPELMAMHSGAPIPPAMPVQPQYAEQPAAYAMNRINPERSPLVLRTNRAWWKFLLLGIITLGIYPMIAHELMIMELNITASRYDGRKTLGYAAMGFLSALTLFVYFFVWGHQYANRLGSELRRRGIQYKMGAVHFWLLMVLFGFTIVCPFIYLHKTIKATNLINKNFNETGI